MTFNDLCTWENEVYCKMDETNIKIMKEILKKIKPFYQKELNEKYDGNIVDYFFRIYFNQKKNNNQKKFDNYLEQFNFNYIASIRNGIYYLLGREDELVDCDIDYSLWPGISNATIDDNKYILDTNIEVVVKGIPKGFIDKKGYRQNYIHVTELNGCNLNEDIFEKIIDYDKDDVMLWHGKRCESSPYSDDETNELEELLNQLI